MTPLRPLLLACVGALALAWPAAAATQADDTDSQARLRERADATRADAINHLRAVLRGGALGDDPAVRAEAMFRLADLLLDEAESLAQREMEEFDRRWLAWEDGGRDGEEPTLDATGSDALRLDAVRTLQEGLRLAPDHRRAGEARFLAGQESLRAGDVDGALRWYGDVVRLTPEDPWVPEALLAQAEVWLERENPYRALPLLRRVAELETALQSWARARLSWALFAVGDLPGALDTVVASLRGGLDPADRESTRALLLRYLAETDDVERARALLDELIPPPMLAEASETLVRGWEDRGAEDLALRLLADLAATPEAERFGAVWLSRVVRLHRDADRFEAADAGMQRLLRTYGPGSAWAAEHPDRAAEATDVCERAQRELAVALHRAALGR